MNQVSLLNLFFDISWVTPWHFWGLFSLSIILIILLLIKSSRLKKTDIKIIKLDNLLETTRDQKYDELLQMINETTKENLTQHNHNFIKLADENFLKHQSQASNLFTQKEAAINQTITPIIEKLQQTNQQVKELENIRKSDYGSIKQQLENVTKAQYGVESETRKLVTALRRPEVRGAWGELTLKRLLELSGLSKYADFVEQPSFSDNGQTLRPDLIINLPENRCLVIDAKTPMDAYLDALSAENLEQKDQHLARHLKNIKLQIKSLSSKKYWNLLENSPDFVILFIPNDSFLSAALEQDHDLLETAIKQKILLATPTSLVALLQTISYGWQQFTLSENTQEIQKLGQELNNRITTFLQHFVKIGDNLEKACDSYNKSVGSVEKNIRPTLNKFNKLGVPANKAAVTSNEIDINLKSLSDQ